ncbi:SDR family oxidoreductase [Actinomadura rudentiformis]|uniref:NAD(P)H-binding protein n=1 Tax=Actinomadura rudentiformis TaxID=359158 RepID=A0A6H9Z5L8_9ACTN|nr:NAD(P)H-binding protein [Actinomadura rudentiformis]KAB2350140.1 NAD(P)H-binding protein [Actinomadura rudentiformis]
MILVTGATGKVGRQVVVQLREAGVEVRALVRDPQAAALPAGVELARGDLTDATSVQRAVEGVDAVFLVWPLVTADGAYDVVAAAGKHARRIVYLSAFGVPDDDSVEPEPGILGFHTVIERAIRGSGLEWTLLRAGGMAGNTLGWAEQVRGGDVVRGAHARATRSLIHEADIAAIAVRALTTDELVGAAPHLTGPQALTQAEQVHTIGDVLGRGIEFEELGEAEAVAAYEAEGLPPEFARGIVAAHGAMVTEPETVSPAVEQITGRPGRTYREWVADHVADFS